MFFKKSELREGVTPTVVAPQTLDPCFVFFIA
jgi:hypothetical protein